MTINENAAYLKGLFEGYELEGTTKEAKIISKMLDLFCDMTDKISALEAQVNELRDYIEEVDEDLGLLEDDFYLDNNESDVDADFDDEDIDDDSGYDELVCPSCGEIICVDENLEISEISCPACGEKFECLVSEEDLNALEGDEE